MADAELERRALEISCEEERIRRLAERMTRDAGDGAELAREKRARNVKQVVEGSASLQKQKSALEEKDKVRDVSPSPAVSRKSDASRGAKKWPPPPYEQRKEVFDELQAALEAISVKGIVDFRHLTVVPKLVEDVAVGVLSLVTHVDDTVDGGQEEKAPPKTWATVQKVMAKPGHLINALRRYPYAVDANRVPMGDVKPAERVLERSFRVQQLEDVHPVAGMLYRWLYAAAHYARLRSADKAQPASGVQPKAIGKFSPAARSPSSPSLPGAGLGGGVPAAGPPRAGPGGAKGTVPAASKGQVPATSKSPQRPGAVPRPGGAAPARAPGMARSSSAAALPPKRPPQSTSPLPSRTPPAAIDMEGFRRELEATKKEVMKLKAQEADMQWRMERDSRKENEDAQKDFDTELMQWRWHQVDAAKEVELENATQQKQKALSEHLESVEFKRQVRLEEKEKERRALSEAYEATCASVAWQEQNQRELAAREKKVLTDHIEDAKDTKDILAQQKSRRKEEEDRTREDERLTEMDFERRKLLEELSRLRSSVGLVQSAYERRRK